MMSFGGSPASTRTCGGRNESGSQPTSRNGGSAGVRAESTCSIAPTRAPVGSRSPHSSSRRPCGPRVMTTYAAARYASSVTKNSTSRSPGGSEARQQALACQAKANQIRRPIQREGRTLGIPRGDLRNRSEIGGLARSHQHGRRPGERQDVDRHHGARDDLKPEALIVLGTDLREQQRDRTAAPRRVRHHRVDECRGVPLATPCRRREHRANAEHIDGLAGPAGAKVVAFRAGHDLSPFDERHPAQVFPAPGRLHLGAIPLRVGGAAKSFSPNGIGAIHDFFTGGGIGND